eukprot:scaffold2406_cov57-Phaeocystis_antarctica.AAC.3
MEHGADYSRYNMVGVNRSAPQRLKASGEGGHPRAGGHTDSVRACRRREASTGAWRDQGACSVEGVVRCMTR